LLNFSGFLLRRRIIVKNAILPRGEWLTIPSLCHRSRGTQTFVYSNLDTHALCTQWPLVTRTLGIQDERNRPEDWLEEFVTLPRDPFPGVVSLNSQHHALRI